MAQQTMIVTRPLLAGRHVVVTGGTGHLGLAVTRTLLAAGATCHLPLRGPPKEGLWGDEPTDHLRAVPGVDLSDESSVRSFYGRLPSLWASVHCAGGFSAAPLADTSLGDLQAMLAINLGTAFLCTREAVARMRASGGSGRIVNVAARVAVEPRLGAGMSAYTASKAALAALGVALAEELAPDGILVNTLAPSSIAATDAPGAGPTATQLAALVLDLLRPDRAAVQGAVIPVYGRPLAGS